MTEITVPLDAIIVDGYVTLGADRRPGLGMHLHEAIENSVPVVGVAKQAFVGTPAECEVLRGKGKNPLFVTSVGISLQESKKLVAGMHGDYRIPTLLKYVDRLSRDVS